MKNRIRYYKLRADMDQLDQENQIQIVRSYIQIDELFQSKLRIPGTGDEDIQTLPKVKISMLVVVKSKKSYF